MGYRIPDVAGSYQGLVDWPVVAAELARRYPGDTMPAGIAKLTEGLSFVDPWGVQNIAGLRAAGRLAIGYHCLTATADPAAQADLFIGVAEHAGCDAVMYDWETFGNPKAAASPAQLAAFHDRVSARWHRPILLYTASWVFGPAGGPPTPELRALPLVLGNPNVHDLDSYWPAGPTLHQYGQESVMPGLGRAGALLDCSTAGPAFLALFPQENPIMAHTVILTNGDEFIRPDGRRRNGYESNPDLVAKINAGEPVTEAEITAVDENAMDWIRKELAAYDRSLEAPKPVPVDVDEAALASAWRTLLEENPVVLDITGRVH